MWRVRRSWTDPPRATSMSEISHSNDRDHGHDATSRSHGPASRRYPRKSLCGLGKAPFAYHGSSHCTHGLRAYRPRGARGYVAVSTLGGLADHGAVLHVAYDCPEDCPRHRRVRAGPSEKPSVNSYRLLIVIFAWRIPPSWRIRNRKPHTKSLRVE